MDRNDEIQNEVTRIPTVEDLVRVCSSLNAVGARYVVVGGAAIIQHGLMRTTHDLDLLVDASEHNVKQVCKALAILPDKASTDVLPSDVANYTVVRINDEFTIDLMGAACGIDYDAAVPEITWTTIDGVRIPFASPQLLWKTKQTHREKDALDRAYLRKWFADHGMEPPV